MLVCAGHAIVQHADFSECRVTVTRLFLITQRSMCLMSRAIVDCRPLSNNMETGCQK